MMKKSANADVWVLTETHLDFSPGDGYRLISSSAEAPDRESEAGERWVAIWSRLPAIPEPLSADLERAAAVRLGSSTIVVGTVLPWLSDIRHPEIRGGAAFRARLAEQAADWLRLGSQPNVGLCVTGDFNQDLLDTGRYYGSDAGRQALRETLAMAKLECLTEGKHDPLSKVEGLACIDLICVRGMKAMGSPRCHVFPEPGTLSGKLTDHYGLWADFEVPGIG